MVMAKVRFFDVAPEVGMSCAAVFLHSILDDSALRDSLGKGLRLAAWLRSSF